MTLAALLAVTTGAWAQGPKVWTIQPDVGQLHEGDILAEGSSLASDIVPDLINIRVESYKKNDVLQTLSSDIKFSAISSFGENCVISAGSDTYAPVDEYGDDGNAWVVTYVFIDPTRTDIYLSGIYYDPNGVALTTNDDRTVWTIDKMPAADVELTVRYYDDAEVKGTAIAATGVRVGENKALVSGLSTEDGTLVYAITAATVTTAPADADFSADGNTAKDLTTEGTYRVWYYVDPDATHSPSDPKSVNVKVYKNKFDITFTAANTNTIEAGKATVSVKDGDEAQPVNRTGDIASGVLADVTMGQTVILTAAEGYKIVGASDGRTVYTSQVAITALQEGDILAEGFSLTGNDNDNIYLDGCRYKIYGEVEGNAYSVSLNGISSIGVNCVITIADAYTLDPVDETWQEGNAWVVTDVRPNDDPINISLAGITYTPLAATLNDAKTEATLTMPACDVALSYDLRRDMNVSVTAEIGGRIRIKKDNNAYVAAIPAEIIPTVTDGIGSTAVTMTDGEGDQGDYDLQLQKLGDDGQTWADATALSVGTFRYKVTGTNLYDGVTYTNNFQLFEGYEVSVPAQEYITYFKDEALTLGADETAAKLYTITAVDGQTATATEVTVAKDNMPILVKNNSTQTRNILLIPTTTATPDDVTVYEGFKGTLAAKTFSDDDMNGKQYYVLAGGKMFARVSGAGTIAANRCWLELDNAKAARQLNIHIGDETTGVEELKDSGIEELNSDAWYDLQGRKLDGQPTRKGMYIHGSKKIIIRTNNQ
jgi:hypothetical protein